MKAPDERLVSFLYLLGRDVATLGQIEALLERSEIVTDVRYSNGHLAAWAREAADRLTAEPEED